MKILNLTGRPTTAGLMAEGVVRPSEKTKAAVQKAQAGLGVGLYRADMAQALQVILDAYLPVADKVDGVALNGGSFLSGLDSWFSRALTEKGLRPPRIFRETELYSVNRKPLNLG